VSDAIITSSGLTRRFGPLTAVDAFTIEVQTGEIFGLLGPNGAGKSTVIKMLTTLLPPTAGQAAVAGFDIGHQAGQVRRVIGYVPQMLSADGALTGRENLLLSAKLYDLPRAGRADRIRRALAFMGLEEASESLVRHYSGGMIRRLEIAQATLHRPRVLFLDEPTIGLDPVARQAVWEHIERLRSEFGATVFMTTHSMEEADALCGRVAIMNLGKIAALGAPADLKAALGRAGATLNDVFVHYAGSSLDSGGGYRETTRTRRVTRRLG
jgi:ABC-2 type transport system ATP-binding protein